MGLQVALLGVEIQGSVADDSYYHTAAAYLQDRVALSERIELTIGGRATYAKADIGRYEDFETTPHSAGSFEDSWTDLSGHVRLSWQAVKDIWLLYTSASQAFRAPGLYDLTSFNVNRSTDIAIPSPNLDPEKFLSGEVGSRLGNDCFSWHIAYFYTDIRDMIVAHAAGGDYYSRANGGDGYVHGIESELLVKINEQWSTRLGTTWMEGYTDYDDVDGAAVHEPIRTIPFTTFVALRWQSVPRKFWVETSLRGVAKEDRLTASDKRDTQRIPAGGTPGYSVTDVRCGWQAMDSISLVAGIENIFDKDYRTHGSGSNEPGRNFVLSMVSKF